MTLHSERLFHAIDGGLLRTASVLVPGKQRAEWRLEWESELWHVRQSKDAAGTRSWRNEGEIAGFCLGAFQDAACLRRLSWQNRPRFVPLHGSAIQCLFSLASLFLVSYLCSLLSPGVRAEHDFASTQVRPGTILIEDEEATDNSSPTVALDQVRNWERSRQRFVDGFAFYRVAREKVQSSAHGMDTWRIAHASSNLFALAGWSLRGLVPDEGVLSNIPRMVLSERTWRQRFGANPGIVGKVLLVGSRPARVIGIAPGDTWRLPGRSDAWLLESDSEIGRGGRAFVIAHLTPRGRSEMAGGVVPITSYDSQQSEHSFLGISLEERQPGPWDIYWMGVLLALLALPAIASVSLAEYTFSSQKPSANRNAIRLGFLGAKVGLLLLIAYYSSIDLAYCHYPALSPAGVYIQLSASFAILLFGMRWALLDQRERCPVCLRRVTHPAQVGSFSRLFLAWSGTELICTGGHTLLHVPGLPTSWSGAQRWLYLDSSWDFLFVS